MAGGNNMFSTRDDEKGMLIFMQMKGGAQTDLSLTCLLMALAYLPRALLFIFDRVLYQLLPHVQHYIHIPLNSGDITNWLLLVLGEVALFLGVLASEMTVCGCHICPSKRDEPYWQYPSGSKLVWQICNTRQKKNYLAWSLMSSHPK